MKELKKRVYKNQTIKTMQAYASCTSACVSACGGITASSYLINGGQMSETAK